MIEAYAKQWKSLSLQLLAKNSELEKERDKWKEVAWLGYKVMYENWEPTQFHSAYMDAMTENGEL